MSASSSHVAKRLQSELMSMMMDPVPGITAFPDGENILNWKATIQGPDACYYTGMEFSLSMTFSNDYPLKAPTVMFDTSLFHPNVDTKGRICLDILTDKWSPTYTVSTILLSIQSLLESPNNASPLNGQAAELWDDKEEYLRLAQKWYATSPFS